MFGHTGWNLVWDDWLCRVGLKRLLRNCVLSVDGGPSFLILLSSPLPLLRPPGAMINNMGSFLRGLWRPQALRSAAPRRTLGEAVRQPHQQRRRTSGQAQAKVEQHMPPETAQESKQQSAQKAELRTVREAGQPPQPPLPPLEIEPPPAVKTKALPEGAAHKSLPLPGPAKDDPIPIANNVAPLPLWQRLGPLTTLADSYGRAQRRRPYVTQLCSALVIALCADLSVQRMNAGAAKGTDGVGGEDGQEAQVGAAYDPKRTVRSLVIGAISAIPGYKW